MEDRPVDPDRAGRSLAVSIQAISGITTAFTPFLFFSVYGPSEEDCTPGGFWPRKYLAVRSSRVGARHCFSVRDMCSRMASPSAGIRPLPVKVGDVPVPQDLLYRAL